MIRSIRFKEGIVFESGERTTVGRGRLRDRSYGRSSKRKQLFPPNFVVDFRAGVNLLVGDQGSGKTTLLENLHDPAKTGSVYVKGDKGTLVFFHSFEKDNPRMLWEPPPGMRTSTFIGMRLLSSHGEVNFSILEALENSGQDATNCCLLLDEPDTALSPRSIQKLVGLFEKLTLEGNQIICACHNPWLIEAYGKVYSLEHREWMKSESFLETHRE